MSETILGVVCGACGGRVFMLTCHHAYGTGHAWVLASVCVDCRGVHWTKSGCVDCAATTEGGTTT